VPHRKAHLALLVLISLLLGGIGGGLITWLSITHTTATTETRLASNYRFINPLIDCNQNASESLSIRSLEKKLQNQADVSLAQYQIENLGIYYRDLNNGPWIGVNETTTFVPASLVKIPLAIYLLKESQSQPALLDQLITIADVSEYQYQNFVPIHTVTANTQYSVRDLLERMVIDSDNVAYEYLMQLVDWDKLKTVYAELGIDVTDFPESVNEGVSPRDVAKFFRILYNASYLTRDQSEYLLALLSRTTFSTGLVAGLPPDTTIAHKFAERKFADTGQRQLHDCGIVYLPGKPYILCVMTKGSDSIKLSQAVAHVSQNVFSWINQQ